VLRVTGAKKTYPGKPPAMALDGAELRLAAGEWLALLGPNGAGKTTLVRSIAGRVRLDGGEIELGGVRLDRANAEARGVLGIVPQDLALHPRLTAAENLRAFGALHGVPRRELGERARWALDWTGLTDRAGTRVDTFSGGMKRRLNIACGVLHRPTVVLLDEPTVGVDPQSRERIWIMLAELRAGGAALLLTTHQLDEAQRVADRIAIIDRGRTIADGTFDALVARTLGAERKISIALDAPLGGDPPSGCALDPARRTASRAVSDVGTELAALLAELARRGARVADVTIERPSLHAVFIALTGRELRE